MNFACLPVRSFLSLGRRIMTALAGGAEKRGRKKCPPAKGWSCRGEDELRQDGKIVRVPRDARLCFSSKFRRFRAYVTHRAFVARAGAREKGRWLCSGYIYLYARVSRQPAGRGEEFRNNEIRLTPTSSLSGARRPSRRATEDGSFVKPRVTRGVGLSAATKAKTSVPFHGAGTACVVGSNSNPCLCHSFQFPLPVPLRAVAPRRVAVVRTVATLRLVCVPSS